MIESDFTARVHSKLSPNVKAWKIRDDYQGGVPDAYYMHLKPEIPEPKPLFIEYKFLQTLPVKDSTVIKPNLSKLQIKWLQDLLTSKCANARVILGAKTGHTSAGVMLTLEEALEGITCQKFRATCVSYDTLAELIETELLYG